MCHNYGARFMGVGFLLWIAVAPSASGLRDEEQANVELNTDEYDDAAAHNAMAMEMATAAATKEHAKTSDFPDDLEGVALAPLSAKQRKKFKLHHFNAFTYNNYECTGSTWEFTTLPMGILQALGIEGYPAPPPSGGPPQMQAFMFAFINPNSCLKKDAQHGGYVYRDGDTIVGANRVTSPEDPKVGFTLRFKAPVSLPYLPDLFNIGRMRLITLPALKNVGACRFTWVHKEEATLQFRKIPEWKNAIRAQAKPQQEAMPLLTDSDALRGGFLYDMCRGPKFTGKNELRWFEMCVPNAPEEIGGCPAGPPSSLQLSAVQSPAAEPPTAATLATSANGKFSQASNVSVVKRSG